MTIKIAILGADQSGKTQLLQRMKGEKFGEIPFTHSPQNDETTAYQLSGQISFLVDGETFQCLDPNNKDSFHQIALPKFLNDANAVLFCIDATDKEALTKTETLFNFYKEKGYFNSHPRIYFVLTKCDETRVITDEQLTVLSKKLTDRTDNIFYTSAKDDAESIKELNSRLVRNSQQPKQNSQKNVAVENRVGIAPGSIPMSEIIKTNVENFEGLVIDSLKQSLFDSNDKNSVILPSYKKLSLKNFISSNQEGLNPENCDAVFLVVHDLTQKTFDQIKREYDSVVQKLTKANIQIFLIYRPEGQKKDEEKEIKPISDDIPDALQKFAETLHIPKKHIIYSKNLSMIEEEKILKEKLSEQLISKEILESNIATRGNNLIKQIDASTQESKQKLTKEAVRKILKETNDTLLKLLLLQNIFIAIKNQKIENPKSNKLWTHNTEYTKEQLANINTLKELFVECLHDTPYHRYDVAFNNQLRKLFSRKNGLDQDQKSLIDFQQTRYKSLVTKETTTRKHIDSLMQGIGRNTPAQATVYTARRMRI